MKLPLIKKKIKVKKVTILKVSMFLTVLIPSQLLIFLFLLTTYMQVIPIVNTFLYIFKNKSFYVSPELIAYNSKIPSEIFNIPANSRRIIATVPASTALIDMKLQLTG